MDEDPLDADQEQEERRAKVWGRRLKEKFPFRRRQSSGDSTEQQEESDEAHVSDFLYSTGQPLEKARFPAPKIDVSAALGVDAQQQPFEKFKFSKAPRLLGLTVQFSTSVPEIIGVGGDDSEEPVIAISRRKPPSAIPQQPQRKYSETAQPVLRRPVSAEQDAPRLAVPPPLIATPETSTSAPQASLNPVSTSGPVNAPDSAQRVLRRKPDGWTSGDLRQRMRADEGRAFLSASLDSPNVFRRKPVGESDSEASSRSVTPQHLSPPPSRGSDTGIYQPPQYPQALAPSHITSHPFHERVVSEGSLRPPSSGSESSSRNPSQGARHHSNLSNGSLNAHPDNHGQGASPYRSQHDHPRQPQPRPPTSNQQAPQQQLRTESPKEEIPFGGIPRTITRRRPGYLGMEDCMVKASLQNFIISAYDVVENASVLQKHPMSWNRVHVYHRERDDNHMCAIKIIAYDSQSSFADTSSRNRKFKLDPSNQNVVTLHNIPSAMFGISIDPSTDDPVLAAHLQQAQSLYRSVDTTQTYTFSSLAGAHAFQAAVSGYTVRFDGIAHLFAISRRRMVVPIYKSHEASNARVEIVHGKGTTRLIAFFSDYPLADCLNFEVRSFDVCEASESKDGLFCVKLVDAKFALPDQKDEAKPTFVSLDTPDYASEHEDITIGFQDEKVRDEFAAALPAEVTVPKKFTLKRRI